MADEIDDDPSCSTVEETILRRNDAVSSIAYDVRTITDEEEARLLADNQLMSPYKCNKFIGDSNKNWDIFYKRNETRFFKDRHWTSREFVDVCNITQLRVFRLLHYMSAIDNSCVDE